MDNFRSRWAACSWRWTSRGGVHLSWTWFQDFLNRRVNGGCILWWTVSGLPHRSLSLWEKGVIQCTAPFLTLDRAWGSLGSSFQFWLWFRRWAQDSAFLMSSKWCWSFWSKSLEHFPPGFAMEECPGITEQADDARGHGKGKQGCEDEWPELSGISERPLQRCKKMRVWVAGFENRPLPTMALWREFSVGIQPARIWIPALELINYLSLGRFSCLPLLHFLHPRIGMPAE